MKQFINKAKEFISDVWNGRFYYSEELLDYYENSPFWNIVSHYLCSTDSKFANIMYLFYGDTDCPCCSFYRGIIFGVVLTVLVGVIV